MKLTRVTIENYRAIARLELPLHPQLTVLHGENGHGKTSVLNAIAVGLGGIPRAAPDVSGIDFLKTDRRGTAAALVTLVAADGLAWSRQKNFGGGAATGAAAETPGLRPLREAIADIVAADRDGKPPLDWPVVAFYDAERDLLDAARRRLLTGMRDFTRYEALADALSPRSDFRDFFHWFLAKEDEELRQQNDRRDFDYRLPELNAVRRAVAALLPGVSRPRVTSDPARFVVSVAEDDGRETELEIDQLGGGRSLLLALVGDLARRMAQANPHRDDPLQSEAVVLIDEVDLRLHPSWQQRVLPGLTRTFPNAQFIVSTRSPQALTTVRPEQLVRLRRHGGGVVATGASGGPVYGAPAGDVLAVEMGVSERPPAEVNEFTALLAPYNDLVNSGQGQSEEALELRRRLETLSARDPALDRADSEMRRRQAMREIADRKRDATAG